MVSFLAFYWIKSNVVLIWAVMACSSLILCYGVAKNLGDLEDDRITVNYGALGS